MTRMRPTLLLPLLVLVACHGRESSKQNPGTLIAAGHIEATDIRIASKVPGRVASFALREGDRVRAGELVAAIETVDLELVRDQIAAERAQAAAELALREAGSRREDIAELEDQIRSTRFEIDGARRDLARMQGLLDEGSGTVKARDDARTRLDTLEARLAAQSQALKRLRSGSRSEEVDAARARLAALSARLAQVQQQIADARVASPIAGVVSHKLVEPGEIVAAGAPLAVVLDLARPWLNVYVPEPDLGRVRLGQELEVVTDGGESRRGRVSFISAEAEFTPKNVQTRDERVKLVFRVKVELPNEDGLFKPGMPAEARLGADLSASAP